jgi:hypothetical protein
MLSRTAIGRLDAKTSGLPASHICHIWSYFTLDVIFCHIFDENWE